MLGLIHVKGPFDRNCVCVLNPGNSQPRGFSTPLPRDSAHISTTVSLSLCVCMHGCVCNFSVSSSTQQLKIQLISLPTLITCLTSLVFLWYLINIASPYRELTITMNTSHYYTIMPSKTSIYRAETITELIEWSICRKCSLTILMSESLKVIFIGKIPVTCSFQPFEREDFLFFFVVYGSKLNVFGFRVLFLWLNIENDNQQSICRKMRHKNNNELPHNEICGTMYSVCQLQYI